MNVTHLNGLHTNQTCSKYRPFRLHRPRETSQGHPYLFETSEFQAAFLDITTLSSRLCLFASLFQLLKFLLSPRELLSHHSKSSRFFASDWQLILDLLIFTSSKATLIHIFQVFAQFLYSIPLCIHCLPIFQPNLAHMPASWIRFGPTAPWFYLEAGALIVIFVWLYQVQLLSVIELDFYNFTIAANYWTNLTATCFGASRLQSELLSLRLGTPKWPHRRDPWRIQQRLSFTSMSGRSRRGL